MYRRYFPPAKLFLYGDLYPTLAELSKHAPFGNQSELPVRRSRRTSLPSLFLSLRILLPLRNIYGRIYSLDNKNLFLGVWTKCD